MRGPRRRRCGRRRCVFFFSSRRRHTRCSRDWSSDVCSSDLVSPDSSFNTAVSFATNTNWQGYGGETTMSYLTQMVGLTVQNFASAASGRPEIGRASCRERGEISVVAVSLKKKKKRGEEGGCS